MHHHPKIVEGFLYNLFADPDIIRLPSFLSPLQSIIALVISKRRAPKSREAYNSIGGGSPILKYSTAQASLLEESLHERYGHFYLLFNQSLHSVFPTLSRANQRMLR